jgi:aldose 1-epimerase
VTTPRLPTGIQYQISAGTAQAKVGSLAAVLREFTVDAKHYVETWDDSEPTPGGCGIVLVPWPNRIADGKWPLNGKTMQLDLTDPGNGHATHGLLRNTSYEPVEITDASVTLGTTIYPQHGYPFTLDTFVTYRLADDGLHVTHRLVNVGTGNAPFGVGAHPYLRVGDHPIADLTLTLAAAKYMPIDERLMPVGTQPVDADTDLRGGRTVGDLDLNTCFTELTPAGNENRATLFAPDGSGLTLWADPAFSYFQIFTPRNLPGWELAVAVEPMTSPANAFNSGDGLRWLAPGETFEGSWGLRPVTAL